MTQGRVLVVEDDGPGIPLDRREQALSMFVTLTAQDKTEGSGLGLPIAKRIVDHYSGGMVITPARSGQGCRVAVWLPDPKPQRVTAQYQS